MGIDELVEKGLLSRSAPIDREIKGSLAIAEGFLEKAKGNMGIGYYDVAFSLAYQAMFHAARALLFRNGLKERSHRALTASLKEIYKDEGALRGMLNTLDSYRITRHAIQYSGVGCNRDDAEEAVRDAEKFIEMADKIVSKARK